MKADLAVGLGTAAIAKERGWNMVSVRRAIRKVRSGASLLTKEKCSKITETPSNYIKEMSEKDTSLEEVGRGTATDFGSYVVEVHDQWSPAHEAQEDISKEGAHVSLARPTRRNAVPFASNFSHVRNLVRLGYCCNPLFVKFRCAILMNKKVNVFSLYAAEKGCPLVDMRYTHHGIAWPHRHSERLDCCMKVPNENIADQRFFFDVSSDFSSE